MQHCRIYQYISCLIFQIPRLEAIEAKFLLSDMEMERKYHLVEWESVKQPKERDRMGTKSARKVVMEVQYGA